MLSNQKFFEAHRPDLKSSKQKATSQTSLIIDDSPTNLMTRLPFKIDISKRPGPVDGSSTSRNVPSGGGRPDSFLQNQSLSARNPANDMAARISIKRQPLYSQRQGVDVTKIVKRSNALDVPSLGPSQEGTQSPLDKALKPSVTGEMADLARTLSIKR